VTCVGLAGNVAQLEIIASIEYGAAVLGTRVLMVLAHSDCSAVKATIDGKPVPDQLLVSPYRPAVNAAGGNLRQQQKPMRRSRPSSCVNPSPVLAGLVNEKSSPLSRAFFDIGTSKVTLLSRGGKAQRGRAVCLVV
jgi:carbonic anhydrase